MPVSGGHMPALIPPAWELEMGPWNRLLLPRASRRPEAGVIGPVRGAPWVLHHLPTGWGPRPRKAPIRRPSPRRRQVWLPLSPPSQCSGLWGEYRLKCGPRAPPTDRPSCSLGARQVQAQLLQFAAKNIGLNPALLTSPINPQHMTMLNQLHQLQLVSARTPAQCV